MKNKILFIIIIISLILTNNIFSKNKTAIKKLFFLKLPEITRSGEVIKVGDIEFISVRGGEFIMGSPVGEAWADENPQHKVKVNSFWIGKYEITQEQYKKIIGINPGIFQNDNHPVNKVGWKDAMKFCKKFNKLYKVKSRLPYEAEWEYASRAGSKTRYYWGNKINGNYCWYEANSKYKSHAVGLRTPNRWGIHDMSGNLWEWCMDWYSDDYFKYSSYDNPKGPAKGKGKVLKGGAWNSDHPLSMRSATRHMYHPVIKYSSFGFRIVIIPQKK